jgi:hypothetical protein
MRALTARRASIPGDERGETRVDDRHERRAAAPPRRRVRSGTSTVPVPIAASAVEIPRLLAGVSTVSADDTSGALTATCSSCHPHG